MTQEHPNTLSDALRSRLSGMLNRIGLSFHRLGIHPDVVTFLGLVVVLIAAIFIAQGRFLVGGVILLLGLPLDAIDGAIARAMQRQDNFGAVLDSTLDRYADGLILGSLTYYYAVLDRFEMMGLALLALVGSYLVSYVRARADGTDVMLKVRVGLFTRLERVAIIILSLILSVLIIPELLDIGVLLLAIGTNFTAGQRLWFVYKNLNK